MSKLVGFFRHIAPEPAHMAGKPESNWRHAENLQQSIVDRVATWAALIQRHGELPYKRIYQRSNPYDGLEPQHDEFELGRISGRRLVQVTSHHSPAWRSGYINGFEEAVMDIPNIMYKESTDNESLRDWHELNILYHAYLILGFGDYVHGFDLRWDIFAKHEPYAKGRLLAESTRLR